LSNVFLGRGHNVHRGADNDNIYLILINTANEELLIKKEERNLTKSIEICLSFAEDDITQFTFLFCVIGISCYSSTIFSQDGIFPRYHF